METLKRNGREAKYYAGKILWVNLSSGKTEEVPTSDYGDFVGGLGIASKIYWDEIPARVKPFDPESKLIFITGPLCRFPGYASSRWEVVGKSPLSNRPEGCFSYANFGGSWGAALKHAGYDGVVVEGTAEKPVYLLIENENAKIMDASYLWGKGAIEVRNILKAELEDTINVLAIGPAGENLAVWATILANQDSSGRAGFGSVMGSKKLKAIAVGKGSAKFSPAYPEKFRELGRYYRWLAGEGKVEYYYRMAKTSRDRPMHKNFCWGCGGPCIRESYKSKDGKEGKFFCYSAMFYRAWAFPYYKNDDEEVCFKVTKLCDDLGLDIYHLIVLIQWLDLCCQAGLLTEKETRLPLSKIGSWEYASSLLQEIARGNGVGKYLRLGGEKAAEIIGKGTKEIIEGLIHKSSVSGYDPREFIAHGILYAMEDHARMDQLHDLSSLMGKWREWEKGLEGAYVSSDVVRFVAKRFWGSEAAADFSSYEGKALAAKLIQDRTYAKNCLILCDFAWPVLTSPSTDDHVGDPTLEGKVFSAVTGRSMDEDEFYRLGEKVFHLQTAIRMREGHRGRQDHTLPDYCYDNPLPAVPHFPELLVPGKNGKPVSRIGAVLDRKAFEQMKDEYYRLRGWDVNTGLPSAQRLMDLGLRDV